jgi:ABC-type branched-subunit amino acid transport system substrate-binding protein
MAEFEGTYLTCHWHPNLANETARQLSEVYREKYSKMPDDVFLNTYDAYRFIFKAIGQAETLTPESIKNEIDSMHSFNGATGQFHYRNGGDPDKKVIVVKLSSGTSQLFKIVP